MQLEAGALEEEEAALCSALSRESLFLIIVFRINLSDSSLVQLCSFKIITTCHPHIKNIRVDESSFFVSASKPDHQHELKLTTFKEFLN